MMRLPKRFVVQTFCVRNILDINGFMRDLGEIIIVVTKVRFSTPMPDNKVFK